MPAGKQVTDAQVKEVRRHLNQGASLSKAAMMGGMDRKTAGKYRDLGQLPSEARTPHTWRTRPDPLQGVWPALAALLEREPGLQAKTLLEWLQREHPEQDWQCHRRTLERRTRQWKAEHGPAKEIFFTQVHEPGRLGSSDFSHMDSLGVTIGGQPFPHLIYHFVLTHSNWEHVTLCFSESFASLSEGMQNALWELGGVPERHRTDRMTMAVHHEGHAEQYTAKYQGLLCHYGVTAEATNAYSGHENGDCEQGHRRFKETLDQELMLRGNRDFASREAYWEFVRALVGRRNRGRGAKFEAERARLRPLPSRRLETLERQRVRVSQGATIQVKKNTYSVPARLRGEWVEARIGAEQIEVWYARFDQEATQTPKVWIPILGENRATQFDRIHDLVKPDEICPVLPSPARNPRRGDDIVIEYHQLLFDQLRLDPRDFLYASEQNPFEVYRQIWSAVFHYNKVFQLLGGCKVALSTLSSKVMSLGGLLVAYELKQRRFHIGVAHIECQGYLLPSVTPHPELVGAWLTGECYG